MRSSMYPDKTNKIRTSGRRWLTISFLAFSILTSSYSAALCDSATENKSPVDLQADSLTHNEEDQTITASGNVVMKQDGRTLKADNIVYNLRSDTAVAVGHVEFTDQNGDKHLAEKVKFNDALKDGFIEGLRTVLADGSRFTAVKGDHHAGNTTTMHDATYTPCEPCKKNPNKAPLWQIRASEVKHDKEDQTIEYKNARFEFMGVPLAYTPYFSHPDGSVKRKSGFLAPSAGYKSELGFFAESSYYWSLAPDKDATLGLVAMTEEAPLVSGEWRQRWENAEIKALSNITYSSYSDSLAGTAVKQDNRFRGYLSSQGLWDINEKWRSGFNINVTSDDQFLRQYDFNDENDDDVLKNEIYAERFSGRDYTSARLLAFQDLRVEEEQEDQPNVLPEIETQFLGEPDSVPIIGGRWEADASLLGLRREANAGQDVTRLGVGLGWNKRLVTDFGLISTLDANARSEFYKTQDRIDSVGGPEEDTSSETRSFASLTGKTSMPFEKNLGSYQAVIEPIVAVTLAPNIDQNDSIPNEDSQDVQIDASNLFEANRFPGLDKLEDQSHATAGVRSGLYASDGSYADVFLGQSYRFSEDDNPFAIGSGLDNQQSDFVGQISARYKEDYSLEYRFQLDDSNLVPQRHEVDASIKVDAVTFSTRYLFAKSLEGTDIDETREQIENAASYYINDKWRVFGSARHDLGSNPGMRKANFGVDYFGQCLSWSLEGERNLTDETSGDSGTEVLFRIGLKNLGEFEATGLTLGGNKNKDSDQ